MVSKKVTLGNAQGLHMRPAGIFSSAMGRFESDVTIVANGARVDGKSPLEIIDRDLSRGTEIEIECDGADEVDALAAATDLVGGGLGG